MLKVTVSHIAPTSQGLVLGLQVEHKKAGWMRFCTTVLAVNDLTYGERQMLMQWLEDADPRMEELDNPLF